MEGWHGVRFDAPLAVTRETIEIVRTVAAGERLSHAGRAYQLPLPGGQGRAHPLHAAAGAGARSTSPHSGPRNLELTGELADGWIGNTFMPEHAEVFLDPLRAGAAKAGRTLADLDLVIPVAVEITPDEEAALDAAGRHARGYAFTIGAMGSGTRTSTTRRSPGRATAKMCARYRNSGWRAGATRPPSGCRPSSAARPT